MGAAAGAGGSDKSDEKKVDTYSNQLKTIQKKKSKDSFLPPSVAIAKAIFKNPVDKLNLNRRMKFANKSNINLQGLSTEQILSKDFKSKLDTKGYTRETPTGNNNDGENNTPTVIKKNIGGSTIQTTAPTEAEVSQSETANADAAALKVKKRGRSMTMMSGAKGVTRTSSDYSLGKKSLLGIV